MKNITTLKIGQKFTNGTTNGYIPKLQYWTTKLTEELNKETPNIREVDRIHRKLDWFIQREWNQQF